MIEFEKIYNGLSAVGKQKRLDISSTIGIFYGISEEGNYRLAFMSSKPASPMKSTKMLRVTQGKESNTVFWTCFDLLNLDAKKVFYTFCENLVESVIAENNEVSALNMLRKRYITWQALFKQEMSKLVSREIVQGLFGELYFLKNYMIEKYGVDSAVNAWSGPDGKSKDFSVGIEWYEVKSVGANTDTVKISSLTQLSSDYVGELVIIHAEGMSDEFSNGNSSIDELLQGVLCQIENEAVAETFINKISAYGISLLDECLMRKFDVKGITHYIVNEDFPRITEKTVPFTEITNVTYELSIRALEKFKGA